MANARETTQDAQRKRPAEKTPQSPQQSYLGRFPAPSPGLEGLNGPLGGPTSPFYGGTVESQASLVARSNTAQQRTTLSDIGLVQGNRHVQRLVSHLQTKPSDAMSSDPYAAEDEAASTQVMAAPMASTSAMPDPDQEDAAKPRGMLSRAAFSSLMPKLSVSQPDDPYEVEADAVADRVMKMPASATPAPSSEGGPETSGEQIAAPKVSRAMKISGLARYASDGTVRTNSPSPITRSPALQRLTVSEPGDAYEVEADTVADEVMKLPAPATPPPPPAAGDDGDDENKSNKRGLNRAVARAQAGGDDGGVDDKVEQDVNSLKGLGQPLPDEERDFFESRMGYDFGNVRIHTGGKAVQTSRDLSARAYAVGTDIAFGQGEYAPGTSEGRRLMAHELTHVVQQGGAGVKETPQEPVTDIASETDVPDTAARDTVAREVDGFMLRELIEHKMEEARTRAQKMEHEWRIRVQRLVKALQARARKNPLSSMNQMNTYSTEFREKVRSVVNEAAGHMWKEYKQRVVLPIISEVVAQSESTNSSATTNTGDMKIKDGAYPKYEAMLAPIGEKSIMQALKQAFRNTDLEKEIGTLIKIPKEVIESAASTDEGGSGSAQEEAGGDAQAQSGTNPESGDAQAQSQDQGETPEAKQDEASAGEQETGEEQAEGEAAAQGAGQEAAGEQETGAQDAQAQEGAGEPGTGETPGEPGAKGEAAAQAGQEAAADAGATDADVQWNDDKLPKPEELRQQGLPKARQTFGDSVTEMGVTGQTLKDALTNTMGQFDATARQPEIDILQQVEEQAREQAAAETTAATEQIRQENAAKTEALHSTLLPADLPIESAELQGSPETGEPEKPEDAVEGEHPDGAQPDIDEEGEKAKAEKIRADTDLKARKEATDGIVESLGQPMPSPQKPTADTSKLDAEKQKMAAGGKKAEQAGQTGDQASEQVPDLPVDEPMFEPQTPDPMMVFRKADAGGASIALGADTEGQIAQLQTSGTPLPKEEKSFFESRMGQDMSNVRIHTGSDAKQLNRALQSEAFTVGNHIAFADGKYQPGTNKGRRLMAHELAHVQQGGPQLKGFGFNIFAWVKRILKIVQAVVNSESALLEILQILKSMALDMLERIKTRLLDALKTGNINAINMQMITDELTVENLEKSFDATVQERAQKKEAELKAEAETKAAETEAQSAADVAELESKKQENEAEVQADEQAAEEELKTDAQTKETELRTAEAEAEAEIKAQHEQAESESQTKTEEAEAQVAAEVQKLQDEAEQLQTDTDEKAQEKQAEAQEKLAGVKQQAEEKFSPEAVSEQINLDERIQGAIKVPADQFDAYKERVYQEIVQEAKDLWKDFKTSVMDATAQDIQLGFQELQTATTEAWKGLQQAGKTIMTTAQTMIKGVQDQIKGIWKAVGENALQIRGNLKQMATEAWSFLKGKATQLWSDLKGKATQLWNDLKTQATQLWDNLKTKATEFWNNVKSMFTGGLDGLKSLGSELLGNLKDTVMNALQNLKQQAVDMLKKLGQDILKKVGEQIVKNGASAAAQTGASAAAVATTAAKGAPITPFAFPAVLRMIMQTIMAGVKNLAELIKNAIESLTKMIENGQKFVSELLQKAKDATSNLQGFGNKMLGALQTKATEAWNWVKEQGTNALNSLAERAQTAIDNLKSLGENAWNNLKSFGENAWNNLKDFGGNIQGLFEKGWDKAQELWKNRESLLKEGVGKLLTWGKNIAVDQIAGLLGMEPTELHGFYTSTIKPQVDKVLLSIGENKVMDFVKSLLSSTRSGQPGSGGTVQAKRQPGATVSRATVSRATVSRATVSRMIQRAVDKEAATPAFTLSADLPGAKAAENTPAETEMEAKAPAADEEARDAEIEAQAEDEAKEGAPAEGTPEEEAASEEEKEAEEKEEAAEKETEEKEKEAEGEEKAAPGEEEEEEEQKAKEGEEAQVDAEAQSLLEVPMEPELPEQKVPQIIEETAGMNASQLSNRESKMWSRIDGMVTKMEAQDRQMSAEAKAGDVQRESSAGPGDDVVGGTQVNGDVEAQIGTLQGGGTPLPDEDRNFFERRMGADFSNVRVHTGGEAEATSQNLQARAYTVGSDIVFNQGEYKPGSDDGRRLLAHELTHVVQQGGAGDLQRQPEEEDEEGPVASAGAVGRVQRSADPGAGASGGGGQTEATFDTFVSSSASDLVGGYATIGEQISSDLGADAAAVAEKAVPLPIEMEGVPEQPENPDEKGTDTPGEEITGDVTPPNPAKLETKPHENIGEGPDNTAEANKLEGGGGLFGWLSALFKKFKSAMSDIRTKDEGVNTKAGESPQFEPTGEADPARAERQEEESKQQVDDRQTAVAQELEEAPGEELVQPQEIKEEAPVEMEAAESPATDMTPTPEMEEYAAMDVPDDVRQGADEVLRPMLEASLAEPKAAVEAAAAERDSAKEQAFTEAQEAVDQEQVNADTAQDAEIEKFRQEVTDKKQESVQESEKLQQEFDAEVGKEKGTISKSVNDRIAEDQKQADAKVAEGEQKAEAEKTKAEEEARKKKEEAQKASENKSWWDRAKDAIKSAIKAVSEVVDKIFTAVREAVKAIIETAKNAAIALIEAGRKWVVEKLDAFRTWVKDKIDKYLGTLFPELAEALNKFVDTAVDTAIEAVNKVAEDLKTAVTAIADTLSGALDALLGVFQGIVQAQLAVITALVTGDFLEAARIIFETALKTLGLPVDQIMGILDRAGEAIKQIFSDPIGFLGNLISGVKLGLDNFIGNILTHLQTGFIAWLTGSLGDLGITMPAKFDLQGIFQLAMQVLGISMDQIKGKVTNLLGFDIFGIIDQVKQIWDIYKQGGVAGLAEYGLGELIGTGNAEMLFALIEGVQAIIAGDWGKVWELIKDNLATLQEMVFGKIKEFLVEKVIKAGITWIISLLNPAGAIVRAVKGIYDIIMFFIERGQQIMALVGAVTESIGAIAMGNVSVAAGKVEGALAKGIPVAIGFLSSLLGLTGITGKVKSVIEGVRQSVDSALNAVFNFGPIKAIGNFIRGIVDKIKGGLKKIIKFLFPKKQFNIGNESHTLSIEAKNGAAPVVYMASTPKPLMERLDAAQKDTKTPADAKAEIPAAKALVQEIESLGEKGDKETDATKQEAIKTDINTKYNALIPMVVKILGVDAALTGEAKRKYDQVMSDGAIPGSVKKSFETQVENKLKSDPNPGGDQTQLLIDVVTGGDFLAKGPDIPAKELEAKGGMTRVIPLKTIWSDNLAADYKAKHRSFEAWLGAIVKDGSAFSPNAHLNKGSTIPGTYATAWWSPRSQQKGNTMAELIGELALNPSTYPGGCIRATIGPDAAKMAGFKKPTALDGIFFKEFVTAPKNPWGITAGGSLEAVAPKIALSQATELEYLKGDMSSAETIDHEALAQQAIQELQKVGADGLKGYEATKAEKETSAETIEQNYTAKLEPDVALTVKFHDEAPDEESQELGFEVKIAPNDTVLEGSVPILSVQEAHQQSLSALQNQKMLSGTGPYIAGHIGNVTETDRKNITNKAKEQDAGCHVCGAKDPGTKSGYFTPDHQPPNSILKGGGGPEVRFYCMCSHCSNAQKHEVSRYKNSMRKLLGRKNESDWAKGVKSDWFWG